MAIKIIGSTIIDDSRNIVNAGIATVTSVSIGNTQVISSARQLQNIASLDATTTATIESAIANAPNTFTDLSVSGVSTLGVTSTTNLTAQQLNVSGVSTLGTVQILSGIVTATSGVVTYYGDGSKLTDIQVSSIVGVVSYADSAGIATYATSSGIATYASTAGASTSLQNSRTFEITGDIVASPISFNGTGNVSLSATIQPNSVALGSDTTGDYVTNITGTSNQITVTSGTGEGSTPTLSIPNQFTAPQDVTVTRDLQVDRNLNVNGNITIGGTSATLFTTEFKVYDPDIVLGVRTDAFGNDVSTDNTANHGGIAIASTEGTPLISLYDVGIGETNPATYKKFMWFKSGTFSGLGTDAWISNYAIGIGSTQVPNGVRLAAGAINVLDNKLNVSGDIDFSGTFYQNGSPFVASRWTAGTGDNIYRLNGNVGIATTNPQSALDVRGAITVGVGTVGINSVFSTTDIQSWYYTNKSKSVSTDDTSAQAIYIGAAGTAMFMVGDTGNDVNQYTLSTPYDVSTAGAAVTTFSVATQETNPSGIDFDPTGTKMFISGQTGVAPLIAAGEYVHEYSLSTPWNIAPSNVGYTTSYNVTQDTAPQGVAFGNSGSKMYVVGSTGDAVYQYSLSTPYSLASGVTYDNISLVLGTNPILLETAPIDISFNSTGTVLWIAGSANDRIYEFRLGTAWDISTAVFYDDVYIGFNEITVTGLHVIPEQNVAYIVGSSSDTIYQYSTNTPALEIASSGISSVSSIVLNNETRVKDKLYVKGLAHFDNSILTQSDLTVNSTLLVNSAVTFDTTTSNINLATSQTTGTLILGGTSQTGTITVGRGTTTQTTNIQAGTVVSGQQKTINLGTGGAAGSRTLITVGSATAGAASTVTIPSPTNLLIGTATTTGTASQQLQVNSGAYVSGSVGIGTTNPGATLNVVPTSTSIAGLFSGTTSSDMVRITQLGTGNALVVEDETNPDTSSFVIANDGKVGIGITNPGHKLVISGGLVGTSQVRFVNSGSGDLYINHSNLVSSLQAAANIQLALGSNNVEVVRINNSNQVGIGTTNPQDTLDVGIGTIRLYNKSTLSRFSQIYQDGALTFKNSNGGDDFNFYVGNDLLMRLYGGGQLVIGASTLTGTASQLLQVTGGAYVSGNVGIGTTNPGSKLTVNGAVQIQQDSGSNNRLVFRGQPSSSYRWNVDNYSASNEFRIFREDDETSANGFVAVSISTTGTLTANKFSGDGSLLTNLPSSGGGSSQWVTIAAGIHTLSNVGIGTTNPTSRLTVSGDASITGILTADQVYTSNNGNGQNVRIGDDFWLGDVNVADTTRFSGAQDSTRAFVIFGSSDAVSLGRTGTGPLYYGGNFNVAGIATATSFSGSGTNLTGIVTSITAGSGISVNQSTGNVTITSTGGASLDILEIMLFA